MPVSDVFRPRIVAKLRQLYGANAEEVLQGIDELADRYASLRERVDQRLYGPQTVLLITYGDQIRRTGTTPLACLREFLSAEGLDKLLSTVHVLPFFPYSSDDGFSVLDYRTVDPALGDWSDIKALGRQFELMFDLVLNHCSRGSR